MENPNPYNKAGYVAIFLILAVTTILYGTVHQAVIGLAYVMVGLLAAIWVADAVCSGVVRISTEPLQMIIYAAGIFGFLQVIPYSAVTAGGMGEVPVTASLDPFATQVSALHFLVLAVFFSIVLTLLSSARRIRRLAVFITVFGAAFAFFAILQSLLSPTKIYGLLDRPYAEPFGSFVSRNNFATWMEMAVAVPLGMLFSGSVSDDKRLIFITAITLMGVSLVLSGSRGGLVVFVLQVGFLLFVTYSRKKKGSTSVKVILAGAILVAIVAGTAFIGGESSLTRLGVEDVAPEYTVSRPDIWSTSIKIFLDNPWIGVGLGAFGVAYTRYDVASGFERVEQAHNDYLQVLTDAGIVGAVLGLLFLAGLFRSGYKALRTTDRTRRGIGIGAMTGVFGVLVHSLFDFGLHTTSIALLFLILVALLIASSSKYEDDDIEQSTDRQRKHRPVRA